jgi:hypothetical protein
MCVYTLQAKQSNVEWRQDNMRAAHELMDAAATPMDIPGDERHASAGDAELDRLLQELESDAAPTSMWQQQDIVPAQPAVLPVLPSPPVEYSETAGVRIRTALPA